MENNNESATSGDSIKDNPMRDHPGGAEQCAICLGQINMGYIGQPNGCKHIFCRLCIETWAKVCSKCPIDRIPFSYILKRKRTNIKRRDKSALKHPEMRQRYNLRPRFKHQIYTSARVRQRLLELMDKYDADDEDCN